MSAHDRPRRRGATALALGGAVAIGAMTAIQARVNGQLGVRIDNGILAGLVSFAVGLVLLGVLVVLTRSGRAGVGRLWVGIRERRVPWWMLVGGACGALTVSTQGLVAGILGVALFSVGVVAGQTLHGLVLDRIGVGPAGVVAITSGRLLGGLLALIAVGVSLGGGVLDRAPLWMLVLPFLTGAGIALQSAVNGRLGQRIASPLGATFMSFVGGVTVLAISAGISMLVKGAPAPFPAEPWLYVGGLLGAAYILLGVVIVPRTGVLLMGLGAVLGQLVVSVLIDLVWPPSAGPAAWQVAIMVIAAVLSVVVALPWRIRSRSRERRRNRRSRENRPS
ncbi:DMT family transporter [Microbacterium capsulatum]|uniref:DMT family transporter n=1 Tax=Microbacterium capsulatum TaxID=3041921 RepID=A0ABU0XH29_9MICO|nr:DMT family transporter [Microbacterium sp. ASV81]MDQ4214442.1 DMT family transporter [Microbacterium sp. ASV81]